MPRAARRLLAPVLLAVLLPLTPLAATGAAADTRSAAAGPMADAVDEARRAREAAERKVAEFRQQVEAATAVLTEGSKRLEDKQAELARTQAEQAVATERADRAVARAHAAKVQLGRMAAASLRSPVPDSVQLALTTGPEGIRDAVVARADLDRVRGSSQDALQEAKAARVAADLALAAARRLTEQAVAQEAAVAAEVAELRRLAEESQRTLEAAAAALTAAQLAEQAITADAAAAEAAARAAAEAQNGVLATCTVLTRVTQANGFLDPATLCPLDDAPGQALRPDAAAAFNAMNDAHKAERGSPICVTDSYRSYGSQVAVYASRPHLAAVPGSSNHGWGRALDLCGGVESFGTEAHVWMRANAGRFGWFHPGWAQQDGSRPEAWHWEYGVD